MKTLSQELVARCFPGNDSALTVSGVSVSSIARRYGTPLFIYDRKLLDCALIALRAALPPAFGIHYSVKANPNLAILAHFVNRGCGLEIASQGELLLALAAGCASERIIFAGPAKTEAELQIAIDKGIGEIHIESATEAMRIAQICSRRHIQVPVSVRVNPGTDAQGGAMRMGRKSGAIRS